MPPPPGLTILYVICKLYNATYFINIKGFKDFYLETKLLLLRSFTKNNKSWIFFTPTIQALLEHSAELIKINNCQGLGAFSESGLDGVYDNSDQSLQILILVTLQFIVMTALAPEKTQRSHNTRDQQQQQQQQQLLWQQRQQQRQQLQQQQQQQGPTESSQHNATTS